MAKPTRFRGIGLEGQANQKAGDDFDSNRGDYRLRTISFVPKIVATTADQPTGIKIGPGSPANIYVNTKTGEATGVTPTLDVGYVGGSGSEIISGVNVSADNTWSRPSASAVVANVEQEISYSLGSNDWADFDGEVIIVILEET